MSFVDIYVCVCCMVVCFKYELCVVFIALFVICATIMMDKM